MAAVTTPYGVAIAGRLTAIDYVPYEKQARSDPLDASRWTPPQATIVHPKLPGFRGPVFELIGPNSLSAAETFTQSLLARKPAVTRIGQSTQGVFSDVLGRGLPNGWGFGLPNERYVTDGKSYDGSGIAPTIAVTLFARSDVDAGRDTAIEEALHLLQVGAAR
jgi:C-terminal processing protease CtpA/Prc